MPKSLPSTESVSGGVVDLEKGRKGRKESGEDIRDVSKKMELTLTLLMVRAALFPIEKTCLGELATWRSLKVPLMVTETERK